MSAANIILLILFSLTSTFGTRPEITLKRFGYPYQNHTVQTSDGYILLVYRLLVRDNSTKLDKPPIVMTHGMVSSADDFLLLGKNSMAFVLNDAGYDVWLLNLRYTIVATHQNLSRTENSYWDFSFDEMGKYDIPECIDYVLSVTNVKKVVHIAMSISNMFYVMMLNERPDMVDKVALNVVLSPSYSYKQMKQVGVVWRTLKLGDLLLDFLGGKKYIAMDANWERDKKLCSIRSEFNLCYSFLFLMFGTDWDQIAWNYTEEIFSRGAYLSIKQLNHIFQMMADGYLSKYDYGAEGNIRRYATQYAPAYSWKMLKPTTLIYWGKNDKLASVEDLQLAVDLLKTSGAKVYIRASQWEHFNHMDYVSGRTVAPLLSKDLLKMLKKLL